MYAGNYRLDYELTRDATSIAFRATHRVMPRRALVKMMAEEVPATTAGFVAVQILREACLAAALQHAGVPAIYESGLIAHRLPWFARELVVGPSLAELLQLGSIDRRQAVVLIRDLAEVLDHAHEHGVVHGGLQPDHVVLAPRPHEFTLCITEWATARAHDASPIPYTPTLESFLYTAPELARGDAGTDRADTFSLGVIAHQLLSGAPYRRDSVSNLDISTISPGLIALVDEMVVDNPGERPSCAEVHERAVQLIDALEVPTSFRIRKPRWTPDGVYKRPASEPTLEVDMSTFGDED